MFIVTFNRAENIILSQDGTAYLIDFDMVDHEDVNYPPCITELTLQRDMCLGTNLILHQR